MAMKMYNLKSVFAGLLIKMKDVLNQRDDIF
jgi:hypothetical protein